MRRAEGFFSGRQVEAFVTQECKQTDMAKWCSLFSAIAHKGFILSLEMLALMHSFVIRHCMYFPYFLSYFILLLKVTYMETEIFWGFLFKFFLFLRQFFLLKLFGYARWIASEQEHSSQTTVRQKTG